VNAPAFLADFHRRFSCRVDLRRQWEFDGIGQPQATGMACGRCAGCESRAGEMGLAEAGYTLWRDNNRITLAWACPSCGITVREETALLSASEDARAIAADALCHRCRTTVARE
jgi:hypothetical protein